MAAPTDLEQLSHNRGQLRPAPAASIWRIDVALGRPVDINRAYASWSQQYVYYRAYQNYLNGGPWAPLALHPDKSWHCKGMAVDTDESPRTVPALARLWSDNGWRFEVPSEPWHGQYYTSLDKNYGKPAGGGAVPLPTPDPDPTTEEDEMLPKIIHRNDPAYGPEWSLVHPDFLGPKGERGYIPTTNANTARDWGRIWGVGGSSASYAASVSRDDYVSLQSTAAAAYEAAQRAKKA